MEEIPLENRWRVLLSCFICLNLGTVLWMNCPFSIEAKVNEVLRSLRSGKLLSFATWADQRYAHAVGLDNRWTMFGHQSRFNWWYFIKGRYHDGSTIVLPVEGQTDRTFWERNFFDFKEAKYRLNIYQSKTGRQGYAQYLCRQFPTNEGSPIQSIEIELHSQPIAPREVAELTGSHRSSDVTVRLSDRVSCPSR